MALSCTKEGSGWVLGKTSPKKWGQDAQGGDELPIPGMSHNSGDVALRAIVSDYVGVAGVGLDLTSLFQP